MNPRTFLPTVLILTLLAGNAIADEPKKPDEPKKTDEVPKAAEPGTLIVIDGAGKEHKLKSWKFSAGVRQLGWLAPAAPADKAPSDKEKGAKPAPKAKPGAPEALVMHEENGTTWAKGVVTLVPLDRIRSIDFDAEKEKMKVRVAMSEKAEEDITLTGETGFKEVNFLSIDAEVDKGDLGIAEMRFRGGVDKGIRSVRFAPPAVPQKKDGRPAVVNYADKKSKYTVNVADLQPLYKTEDGEVLSPLLFFKKTVKIDVDKLKKITSLSAPGTVSDLDWQLSLKSGDDAPLTLMTAVQLNGKNAELEGLVGRVPAGYRHFPIHLLTEIEFDVKKDETAPKKPDAEKP